MSLPVIFLHILAARAVEDGGSSLITVFKPTNTNIIILHELSFNRNFFDFMLQEGNADPALKLDFDIFLLFFQIPFGPAEMIRLLGFQLSEVFIIVEYVHVRTKKRVSVPKEFSLLDVWSTELTPY